MSENSCHYYILLSKKIKIQLLKADKELPSILCTWRFIYWSPKWWQTMSLHLIRTCFFILCLGTTGSNLSRSILSHTLSYLHCMGYGLFHMAYYIDLQPSKSVIKNVICLKLFWYKVFCPLKIKVTQLSNGFHLIPFDNICSFIHKVTVTIV